MENIENDEPDDGCIEEYKSIKCYLKHCIKPEFREFILNEIKELTRVSSLMFRRSSLLMNYHIKRLLKENKSIPDFKTKSVCNTTYFKHMLTIGLDDYANKEIDKELLISYEHIKDKLIENSIDIKLHNQLITYNAILLRTVFINNIYLPFEKRILNFCKALIKVYKEKDIKSIDLIENIENNNTIGIGNEFIKKHIEKINEIIKEPIINIEKIDCQRIYKVYEYIGLFIRENGLKNNISVFPLFSVSRKHIRLDTVLLIELLGKNIENVKDTDLKNNMKTDYKIITKSISSIDKFVEDNIGKKPFLYEPGKYFDEKKYKKELEDYKKKKNTNSDYDMETFKQEEIEYKQKTKKPAKKNYKLKEEYDEAIETYVKNKETLKKPLKSNFRIINPPTKEKFLNREKYDKNMEKYNTQLKELKKTKEYIELEKKHETLMKTKEDFIYNMFNIKFKNVSLTINTDGVSVSFLIKKNIKKDKIKDIPKKEPIMTEEKWNELTDEDKYLLKNKVVVGLDPGRVTLATLAFKYNTEKGLKTKKFSLKRSQYYNLCGFNKISKIKNKLFKDTIAYNDISFETYFSEHLGSIKTMCTEDTINYIDAYNRIKDKWWEIELQPIQSINKMESYRKKNKVLDKFFNKVKKEINKITKEKEIIIAYGNCGKAMKSNGKGELSVPTTTTWKSCKRIFNRTILTNEYNSTCICHKCTHRKEKVYHDENNHLFHTNNKYMPRIWKPYTQEANTMIDKINLKKQKRKFGLEKNKTDTQPNNYPEVRGLRYCTNCRKFLDRDVEAAISIGLFQILQLKSLGRPIWSCSKKKEKSLEGSGSKAKANVK